MASLHSCSRGLCGHVHFAQCESSSRRGARCAFLTMLIHGRLGFSVPPARLAEWHAAALVDQAFAGPTERPALDTACLLLPGALFALTPNPRWTRLLRAPPSGLRWTRPACCCQVRGCPDP